MGDTVEIDPKSLEILAGIERKRNKIEIVKSSCADTRTCDYTKVTKETLLKNSEMHISDVRAGINFLIGKLLIASYLHDNTKITGIDSFHNDFKTGFTNTTWWEKHQREERHHFNTPEYVKDDINLIDVIEQVVDGVMAGMARSGSYRFEPLSNELLQKAYSNTAKLLLDNLVIVDG